MAIGTGLLLAGASVASGAIQANAASKAASASTAAADAAAQLQQKQFEQTTANYKPFLDAGNSSMQAYLYEMGLGPKPSFGATAPNIETIAGATREEKYRSASNSSGGREYTDETRTVTDPSQYKVGDKTFTTLSEAKSYAEANKTGGKEYGGYTQSPMAKYLMEEGVDSIQGSAAAGGGLFSGATLEALEGNRRNVIGADTQDYFSKLFGLSNMGMAAAGNQAGAGSAYANNVGQLQMGAAQARGQGYMGAANAFSGTIGDLAGTYGYFNNPMSAYAAPTLVGGFGGGR
jgi:hypothetical protein